MFEHLVESGSHSEDLKRKGSFLAGFVILYVVLIFTGLIVGILGFGLFASTVISPRIKALHQAKYLGPVEQRAAAAQQLARLHAVSMSGNLLSLVALILYTWRASNPADPLRFVGAQKFRG